LLLFVCVSLDHPTNNKNCVIRELTTKLAVLW
jgi:hypothetical protein